MIEFKEILMKRALTFFNEGMEISKGIDQLSSLPCYYLREINEETSIKLTTIMGLSNINELAQVDLDQQKDVIEQEGWDFLEFEKWVLAAKIISRIANLEVIKAKKVILIGLANAGKSAIRETIIRKYQSNEISFHQALQNLQPTRGVEQETISIFDNKIHLWDMGGQRQYRESYLKEPEKFLLKISAIIYVIDVQDDEKHNAAIEYLRNLAETFRSLNENPEIVICFHKFDPNIQQDQNYRDRIDNLWEKITIVLNENRFQFRRFETSIFDDFSLFHFFSKVINSLIDLDVGRIINMILENVAHDTGLQNLIMLSENGLQLGEYMEKGDAGSKIYEELYQLSIFTLISFKRLNNSLKNKKHLRSLVCSFFSADRLNFLMTRIIILNQSLYVVSLDPSRIELEEDFILTLMPWLSNLFVM